MHNKKLVPVFIDKSVGNEFEQTIRFYYFVVTFREDSRQESSSELIDLPYRPFDSLKPLALPVLWLESNHRFVLSGPLGGGYFTNVKQVDELFELFEQNDLVVDAIFHSFENRIGQSHLNIKRGEIYRLDSDVISDLRSTSGEALLINNNNMLISSEEADVFSMWNRQVIDEVRVSYRKQPEKSLRQRVKRGKK